MKKGVELCLVIEENSLCTLEHFCVGNFFERFISVLFIVGKNCKWPKYQKFADWLMNYGIDIYNMLINEKEKKYNPRHYVQDDSVFISYFIYINRKNAGRF